MRKLNIILLYSNNVKLSSWCKYQLETEPPFQSETDFKRNHKVLKNKANNNMIIYRKY